MKQLLVLLSLSLAASGAPLAGTIRVSGTDPWTRAYGRATHIDIESEDGAFALFGSHGDGTRQEPGRVADGTATAIQDIHLSLWSQYIPLWGTIYGQDAGVIRVYSSLRLASDPVVLPIFEDPGGDFVIRFVLPATRFTLAETQVQGTYRLPDSGPYVPSQAFTTSVSGGGYVQMYGLYTRSTGFASEPSYFMTSAVFTFGDQVPQVPEPSTALLAIAGLLGLVLFTGLRRGRYPFASPTIER